MELFGPIFFGINPGVSRDRRNVSRSFDMFIPVQNWKMPLKVSGSLATLMGFSAFGIGRIEPTNIRNTIDSIEATAAASCTAAAT